MKKLLSLALVLMLVLSMTVAVSAKTFDNRPGETNYVEGPTWTDDGTVYVTVAGTVDPVYYVVVDWKPMQFTYTDSGTEWDPLTHKFENITGGWSADAATDDVTVTNHSNAPVVCDFSVIQTVTSGDMKVSVTEGKTLASAAETSRLNNYDNADSVSANVTISGAPGINLIDAENENIATIRVTLSKVATP